MGQGAITFVHLSGTPFERGREHGRLIPETLRGYWDELVLDVTERSDHPMSEGQLRDWVVERAGPALALAPDLGEEIRGMADGSGVDWEVALAVNLGEECNHLAYSLGWHAPEVQRCLSIVVPPSQSATGGYLLAQTWDGPDWTPDPYLFAVEEDSGRSVYLADPGWVGGVGVNDRGLGSVHTGVGTRTDGTPGLPYSFIARRIMQSDDVDTAAGSVTDLPATAGCHYVITDGDRVLDVETAGTTHARFTYESAVSTCAHFEDPTCAASESDPTANRVSRYRVHRLLQLLAERAPVSQMDVMWMIADHQQGPDGAMVCRHPGTGRSLGGIVIDLVGRKVLGKAGNPCLPRPITEVEMTDSGFESRTFSSEGVSVS